MTSLYCIFNRNDPTPTASALKNVDWEDAVVIIVGRSLFSGRHENNLRRLKAWTIGSGKEREWPEGVWSSEWDWEPVDDSNISYLETESIVESVLDGIQNGDFIDLTSGTKQQSGDLVCLARETGLDIELILQTQGGETLDLITGNSRNNPRVLSLCERIWLSCGYVIDAPHSGDSESADVWLNAKIDSSGKKIIPMGPMKLAKKLKQPHGITRWDRNNNELVLNIQAGYWLEYASSHLMNSWPNVVESFSAIRLIPSSFNAASGAAWFNISNTRWKRGKFPGEFFDDSMNFREREEKWSNYLRTPEITDEQKDILRKSLHKAEFDAAALTEDGSVIICECKHTNNPKPRDIHRIHSISKQTTPPSSVSVLVHSGENSEMSHGVCLISWPDLAKPNIIEQIRK